MHLTHDIHVNSLRAYRELNKQARKKIILQVFREFPSGLTDRQVAEALGFEDLNAVRPRITELLQESILKECATTKDRVTGRTVRVVRLKRPEENTQPELF